MKKIFAVLGVLVLAACGENSPEFVGKWVEPVPGLPELKQGFNLKEDGTAESIGMATLLYETWVKKGDTLVLTGKSVGNRQTLDFKEEYQIVSVNPDTLVLKRGDWQVTYNKCTDCE